MPPRSKVFDLPQELREELETRMVEAGFGDYQALSDWLKDHGHDVSRSSLQRHGATFERQLVLVKQAAEQSKALVEAIGDDAGSLSDANLSLIQTNSMNMLFEIQANGGKVDLKTLKTLGHMIADVARATTSQKKWANELRNELEKRARQAETVAKKKGLTADDWEAIRAEFLGVDK